MVISVKGYLLWINLRIFLDIVTVYYKLSIISFRQTMFLVECFICAINAETIDFLFSKMNGLGETASGIVLS